MEPEVYDRFYVAEDSHWWFRARRRLIANVLEQLYPGGELDIVDMGCGTGGMTQMLTRFGRVTGVDEAVEAREYCARRGVRDVVSLEEWDRTDCVYDLVTAFDVVEHVEDPLYTSVRGDSFHRTRSTAPDRRVPSPQFALPA